MSIVRQLLQNKGSQVWTTVPDATVFDALQLMAEQNVGALPVLENGRLQGIFSERDYARKVILYGRSSRDTRVGDIMSSQVFIVRPDQTMRECMTLMTDHFIRHLPVLDEDEQLMGIISIGDVVKAIIAEQETLIGHLENYIAGARG
jgi:CBS domain-containing protein